MRGFLKLSDVTKIKPQTDSILRLIVVAAFFIWNMVEGAVFENEYPKAMVALYPYPLWRLMIPVLLYLGASWCPSVGIMLAFFVFFYVMDMEVTLDKWVRR